MLKKTRLIGLGAAVALVAALMGSMLWSSPAHAQTMYLDFTQGKLSVVPDECMNRVRRALSAESWAIGGDYRAPERGGYFVAWKGNHGVIVHCDIEPAGGSLFNMTMSGLDEGNRPLMDALADQIRTPRPAGPTGPTGPGGLLGEGRFMRVTLESSGKVTVSWQGLTGTNDWISIRPAGTPDDIYDDHWKFTGGGATGSIDFGTLASGEYEARLYLDWPAGGYNVVDRVRFRVP